MSDNGMPELNGCKKQYRGLDHIVFQSMIIRELGITELDKNIIYHKGDIILVYALSTQIRISPSPGLPN
jgi:hypothetical protein